MKIKIALDSISKINEKIFGNIYFESSSIVFPERTWNDFIIIIINWWLEELIKFENNEKISAELLFMDGPLSIKINHIDNDNIKCYFIHKEIIKYSIELPIREFIKSFLIEVNMLILYLRENELTNEEVKKLNSNYDRLSHLVKQKY